MLFATLIIKLGFVQLVYGESYKNEVEKTVEINTNISVPRGQIYDRMNRGIVQNVPLNAITYTKNQQTKSKEMIETAKKLAAMIDKDDKKLTERDLKDYWILTRPEEAKAKLTMEELRNKKLTSTKLYKLQLERITSQDLAEIGSEEREIAAIFRELNKGYALTTQIIDNVDVSPKEVAIVSENLTNLPNVDVTTDWNREYPYGDLLRSVLGRTTTSDEGLPREKLNYFLSRGYDLNDRVGISQLEEQYEDVLQGSQGRLNYVTDKAGNVLQKNIAEKGSPGNDLILSIDIDLQQEVEKIIESELIKAKSGGGAKFLDRAFVVMMNPNTGEVLAMAGKAITRNKGKYEIRDYALGTFTSAYAMGSAVKGATVLTALDAGLIKPGTVLRDEKIYLKGSPPKGSYSILGPLNDLDALKKSSNVYMFKIALKMYGLNYRPQMPVPKKPEAVHRFRSYFSQFGLGIPTEIDLPNEATGYAGDEVVTTNPGLLLDFAIGQYDTYTPMQMAQYVSTIANGGYRLKPQVVQQIRKPSFNGEPGIVVKPFQPVVLNRISMDTAHINRVKEGFRQVMQSPGGTATRWFGKKTYKPAGKTGTAQSFYYDNQQKKLYETYNLTLVGYAPFDQPEISFSVVVPYLDTDKHPINKLIGERILDTYFQMKNNENADSDITPTIANSE